VRKAQRIKINKMKGLRAKARFNCYD